MDKKKNGNGHQGTNLSDGGLQSDDFVTQHQATVIAQEATHAAVQETAPIVAEKAIEAVLTKLGINASDAEHMIETQKDMAFMRSLRRSVDEVPKIILKTILAAVFFLLILGATVFFKTGVR